MNLRKGLIIILILAIFILAISMVTINKNRDYDIEVIKTRNYYELNENGKIGVINTRGEIIIEPIYDDIQIPNPLKPVFICLTNINKDKGTYKTTIRNDKNEEIFTEFDEVSCIEVNGIVGEIPYEKSVLKYKKDNRFRNY